MNKISEEEYLIKLGKKIFELREAKGLTREKLAYEVDTTRMQIYRIEKGIKKNSPTITLLMRISNALNIDIAKLIK